MNPGGSVKDRAALFVVKDAEEKGKNKNQSPRQCGLRIDCPVPYLESTWTMGPLKREKLTCMILNVIYKLGLIKPGGTVVEGTAGNTGIGLAHVCRAKGYKCVIYMPNTQSQEKIDLLRMLGKLDTVRSIIVRGQSRSKD